MPLEAKYSYDECLQFAGLIATHANEQLPKFTSIERMTDKRKGKLYIDFLQNRPTATLAAPYSLRPKPGATVSMPLHREEVKKDLTMKDFHLGHSIDRIKAQGDIFHGVLDKGIDMMAALRNMAKL